MSATLADARRHAPRPGGTARAGRSSPGRAPSLIAGLALVALHLLDLAFSGPTRRCSVLAIVAVPAAWALAQPHVTRPTRLVLGVVVGLLTFGFGVVRTAFMLWLGPDWADVTGVGMVVGGLLVAAAGLTAIVAPRRAPAARRSAAARSWRWLARHGPSSPSRDHAVLMALMATHARRWAIQESSLGIAHAEVTIETADGHELSAWYVLSRNRTAVSAMVRRQPRACRRDVRMLARHGWRAAFDNPATARARATPTDSATSPSRRGCRAVVADPTPDVTRGESRASARRWAPRGCSRPQPAPPTRAVVAECATRPQDAHRVSDPALPERTFGALWFRRSAPLGRARGAVVERDHAPHRAAPGAADRGGVGAPDEIPANRVYREEGGPTTQPRRIRTRSTPAGLRTDLAEDRATHDAFLDEALGLRRESATSSS